MTVEERRAQVVREIEAGEWPVPTEGKGYSWLGDEVRRLHEALLLAHPKEIEQWQVVLAGIGARAASDDLAVERTHLRRAQTHDAINARLVATFGEQHRVGEHARLATPESREDVAPILARAVQMLRAQPALAAQVGEFAAERDEREKDERFALAVLRDRRSPAPARDDRACAQSTSELPQHTRFVALRAHGDQTISNNEHRISGSFIECGCLTD